MTEQYDPQKIQRYLLDAQICIQGYLNTHPCFQLLKSSKYFKKSGDIIASTKSDYLLVVLRKSAQLAKGHFGEFRDFPKDGIIFRTWEDNKVAKFILIHPSYSCVSYCVIRDDNEHLREIEKYAKLLNALNNPSYLTQKR